MFEIGSYVIYRAEGVCVISDIRRESFGTIGEKTNYYILIPLNDEKSTVFVPTDNEALVKMMRPLLSVNEILQMAEELRHERLQWIPESRARNIQYREILSVGDRRELIVLANSVWEYMESVIANGKKPNTTEENALKRATKLLFEEFSVTAEIASEEDILPVLRGEMTLLPKKPTQNEA